MKRILISVLTLAVAVSAQTPTVVEKPAAKPAAVAVKPAPQTVNVAKPTPGTKAVSAPAKTPVVSVQAAPVKASVQAKTSATAAKPVVVAAAPAKPATAGTSKPVVAVQSAKAAKPVSVPAAKPAGAPAAKATAVPAKTVAISKPVAQPSPKNVAKAAVKPENAKVAVGKDGKAPTAVAVQDTKANEKDKKEPARPTTAAGRRDPFISPVVNLSVVGSGCSSGKRCLAIDQIALRGVVKSDTGMIAVVVNAMDKAYFLRENDPVFNGYVEKITVDSIVFKESFKDRLGKPLTRDVTKTISRPAA